MDNLTLEESEKTPAISFSSTGRLEIRGCSIPEKAVEFYKPLNAWIDAYGKNPPSETAMNVKLEYFNTSSSKCILNIFKRLESIDGKGTKVHVNWYFEMDDEDMEEMGEDYQAIISLPFKMIEVEKI